MQSSYQFKWIRLNYKYLLLVCLLSSGIGLSIANSPLIGAGLFGILGYALIALVWPELVISTLLLLLPLDVYVALSGLPGFFLSQLVIAVGFVSIMFSLLLRIRRVQFPKAALLLWLLPVAGLISLLASHAYSFQDFKEVLKVATFPMVVCIVVVSGSSNQLNRRRMALLVLSNLVVVTYGYFMFFTGGRSDPLGSLLNLQRTYSDVYGGAIRQSSTFRYPTELAAYLLMLILLITSRVWSAVARKQRNRFSYIGLLSLSTANIGLLLLSLTRGTWIALGTVLVASAFATRRKDYVVPMFLLFGIVVFVLSSDPTFGSRFASIFDFESYAGLRGRALVWQGALQLAAQHPWTGVGLGLLIQTYQETYAFTPYISNAENIFLTYLAEMGIVGLLSFVIPLSLVVADMLVLFKNNSNQRQNDEDLRIAKGASLAVLGVLLYSLVDPVFTSGQNGVLFWMLAALIMVEAQRIRGNSHHRPNSTVEIVS